MKAVKAMDPSRWPIHYERFGIGKNTAPTLMAACLEQLRGLCPDSSDKSLTKHSISAGFVHAMFNSWARSMIFQKFSIQSPRFGWCYLGIQDQALWNKRDPNRPILAYGGGFGEAPNDHYFIHKGVVSYDRTTEGNRTKPHFPGNEKGISMD
jgi:beta-galactosidase